MKKRQRSRTQNEMLDEIAEMMNKDELYEALWLLLLKEQKKSGGLLLSQELSRRRLGRSLQELGKSKELKMNKKTVIKQAHSLIKLCVSLDKVKRGVGLHLTKEK